MKNINQLISQIQTTDDYFKNRVVRTIDKQLTLRNWLIGFYIVEYEQNGSDRAIYGKKILDKLGDEVSIKGLSSRTLKLYRQFFLYYHELHTLIQSQIMQTVSAQFELDISIVPTLSAQLQHLDNQDNPNKTNQISQTTADQFTKHYEKLLDHLSFSHFVELMKISEPNKRLFYEIESTNGIWSVRELKRQINSLTYERSAAAKNPEKVINKLTADAEPLTAEQIIKTPYVFDF